MDWQDRISAPKDGTAFLGFSECADGNAMNVVWFDDNAAAGFPWSTIDDDVSYSLAWLTHWMPLPTPPGSDTPPAAAEARAAPYHFWMNMRRFGSVRPQLTGAEIKTIANANPQSPVYRDVFRRTVEDEPVGDGELVDINDRHFYTLLPATTHRGML